MIYFKQLIDKATELLRLLWLKITAKWEIKQIKNAAARIKEDPSKHFETKSGGSTGIGMLHASCDEDGKIRVIGYSE